MPVKVCIFVRVTLARANWNQIVGEIYKLVTIEKEKAATL